MDKPCNRKIIWEVDVVGNEGKSFFQRNICEEFGENARNTDIFLFNVYRAQYLHTEQYEILEKIKDGCATSLEYNGRIENFKTPNVLIVFANRKPNIEKLSEDRWIILKISKDLSGLTDITNLVKNKKKKIENESDDKVSQPRKLCPEEEPRTRFTMARRFETIRRTNLFLIQQFDINCF